MELKHVKHAFLNVVTQLLTHSGNRLQGKVQAHSFQPVRVQVAQTLTTDRDQLILKNIFIIVFQLAWHCIVYTKVLIRLTQ